ncbi:hypothetical protein HK101_005805 [Irineochytrium annulatum]|nr:hypothetical protein HK101_005805 [Irineochytrium annulatum]
MFTEMYPMEQRYLCYTPGSLHHIPMLPQHVLSTPPDGVYAFPPAQMVVVPPTGLPPQVAGIGGIIHPSIDKVTNIELTFCSNPGLTTLVDGFNGMGTRWAIKGTLRLKNRDAKIPVSGSLSVQLAVTVSGRRSSHQKPDFVVGLGQFAPVYVSGLNLKPGEVYYAPFEFTFGCTTPPSLHLLNVHAISELCCKYLLTATLTEQPGPKKKNVTTTSYEVPVPYYTRALLKFYLTSQGPHVLTAAKPNPVYAAWHVLASSVIVSPGENIKFTVTFNQLGNRPIPPIQFIQATLYEAYGSSEHRPSCNNRRISESESCQTRLTIDRAKNPSPTTAFSLTLDMKVPDHAPQAQAGSRSAVTKQVNFDGRWMDVVVCHSVKVVVAMSVGSAVGLIGADVVAESIEFPVMVAPCSREGSMKVAAMDPEILSRLG